MAKERIESDFYPSPFWTIKAMFDHIEFNDDDVCLEPSAGDGRIVDHFPKGHTHKWAEISCNRDYLNPDRDYSADVIITNPPYSLALEFIKTALERDLSETGTCCMLLRVGILGSKERADFWRQFPFSSISVMSPRPSFVHGGSDNSEYAWFIWDYGNRVSIPAMWTFKREEHDPEYAESLIKKAARKLEIQALAKASLAKRLEKQALDKKVKEMILSGTTLKGKKLMEEAKQQVKEKGE